MRLSNLAFALANKVAKRPPLERLLYVLKDGVVREGLKDLLRDNRHRYRVLVHLQVLGVELLALVKAGLQTRHDVSPAVFFMQIKQCLKLHFRPDPFVYIVSNLDPSRHVVRDLPAKFVVFVEQVGTL